MLLSGWGKYPVIKSNLFSPNTINSLINYLSSEDNFYGIARGMGRSYGDSSLSSNSICTNYLNHFISFDSLNGILTCFAGVSLSDIIDSFVPKGWFLPVTPGTKFVTVGGAIASDVHGKNHHWAGSFSDYVISFRLALHSGEIVNCSRSEHPDLFYATCGGMGLTGIITDATFELKPISSAFIDETTIKADNLEEILTLFDEHSQYTYSVAWIDCLSTGKKLGRSFLILGEHSQDKGLSLSHNLTFSIPFDMPDILLNRYTVNAFNTLYYNRFQNKKLKRTVHLDQFFYPLDGILEWNRLYGKKGFTQYQFVVPKSVGYHGLSSILNQIAKSKRGSFLAVLKTFGKGNANFLSFPIEGYTLALDLKIDKGLFALLSKIDDIVTEYGGRIYLTKDVRMSEETFKAGYPQWKAFYAVRKKYHAHKAFASLQSNRLGL